MTTKASSTRKGGKSTTTVMKEVTEKLTKQAINLDWKDSCRPIATQKDL